ncbi:protein kinase domain-containing protein [Niveibacterium terrae]|uniref:protein kinase domain-containing protein n=1 Tax=Niveibacterium terrae TaxID=3373598 RepID=UPI003A8DEB86
MLVAPTGAGGTVHVDSLKPGSSAAETASIVCRLVVGQTLSVNGHAYRISSELTANTSEARTYIALAEDGRQVVIKHYLPGVPAPQVVLRRLQSMPHRNVVGILDLGHVEAQDVEVLEYITGGTLDQYLRRHGAIRDVEVLRKLVSSIADGLEHLHDQVGLIYQDLKPENILLADPGLSRAVLADFGISTLHEQGSRDVRVTANGTREYAAPELSRFGNQTDAFVTEKVDYFALGITLLECWLGGRPFQGLPDGRRLAQIQDKEVPFPLDIDKSLETLIKGLIHPGVKDRFGRDELRRWINRQPLHVDYTSTQRVYQRRAFRADEYFEDPAQLADLLERYPEKGGDYLYLGSIQKWLDLSEDMELSTEMQKIVRLFDRDEASRQAGLTRAIYALDVERPFVSVGGRRASTIQEIADALLAEKDHYVGALKNPNEPLYMYLQARGESEFASDTLARFAAAADPNSALSLLIYLMHGEGRNQIKLGDRFFFTPDELHEADASIQKELVEQLQQEGSRLLIWLQRLGVVERLDPVHKACSVDKISIFQAFSWLSLKELFPAWTLRQGSIAIDLIRGRRQDLLPVFVAQGLDFNSTAGSDTPLVWAAGHGLDDAVGYMLEHGAKIDQPNPGNVSALEAAASYRRRSTVELLLARGASADPISGKQIGALALACAPNSLNGDQSARDPAIMDALLKAGASATRSDSLGATPLHRLLAGIKAGPEMLPMLEALLAAGADIHLEGGNLVVKDQPDCDAWFTALQAIHFNHLPRRDYAPILARLVAAGADVTSVYGGKAALHWAAAWWDDELVKALLVLKASPDQVAGDDMLPGTYAKLVGANGLEEVLRPSAALRRRMARLNISLRLIQGLALAILTLMLFFVGSRVNFRDAQASIPSLLAWCAVLPLLGLLVSLGSLRRFALCVRRMLSSRRGWWLLLIGFPAIGAMIGLVGAYLFWTLVRNSELRYMLTGLAMPLALPYVLVQGISLLQIRRSLAHQKPWLKYLEPAGDDGKRCLPVKPWILLASALPFLALFLLVIHLADVRMGPGSTQAEKPRNEANGPAQFDGRGVLSSPFTVRLPNGRSCKLPKGTELALREGTGLNTEIARVLQVSGPCRGDLSPQSFLLIPSSKVRRSADVRSQ